MNLDWKTFLISETGTLISNDSLSPKVVTQNFLCSLRELGILTIAGLDAATFLQGQITCNVHDITESKSCLGAICNPKGRVITTFLLAKKQDSFLMLLPIELLEAIKNRLQMYVLRSKVTLTNNTDDFCLIGCCQLNSYADSAEQFGVTRQQENRITINFSRKINRQILISSLEDAKNFWREQTSDQNYLPAAAEIWRSLDVLDGIPWLDTGTSEEYIPQMLNLDLLGGISFTKGCYTGQEVVARTHYLGKSKRQMFTAESDLSDLPEAGATITDDSSGIELAVGNVLQAQIWQSRCILLLVLQISETGSYQLKLGGNEVRLLSVN